MAAAESGRSPHVLQRPTISVSSRFSACLTEESNQTPHQMGYKAAKAPPCLCPEWWHLSVICGEAKHLVHAVAGCHLPNIFLHLFFARYILHIDNAWCVAPSNLRYFLVDKNRKFFSEGLHHAYHYGDNMTIMPCISSAMAFFW